MVVVVAYGSGKSCEPVIITSNNKGLIAIFLNARLCLIALWIENMQA